MTDERLVFIDRAAAIRGVSRTEFVLRPSEAAVEMLNERPVIALDTPVKLDARLKERFSHRPLWER